METAKDLAFCMMSVFGLAVMVWLVFIVLAVIRDSVLKHLGIFRLIVEYRAERFEYANYLRRKQLYEDDRQPIDEQWLRACGWEEDPDATQLGSRVLVITGYTDHDLVYLVNHRCIRWRGYMMDSVIKHRRDLRNLCRALSYPVPYEEDSSP